MMSHSYRVSRVLLYQILATLAGIPITRKADGLPLTFSGVFRLELPHYDQRWDKSLPPVPGGAYNVHVVASQPPANRRKSSKHRIHIECRCGKLIPFGRLHQHMPACPNKDEADATIYQHNQRDADVAHHTMDYEGM